MQAHLLFKGVMKELGLRQIVAVLGAWLSHCMSHVVSIPTHVSRMLLQVESNPDQLATLLVYFPLETPGKPEWEVFRGL